MTVARWFRSTGGASLWGAAVSVASGSIAVKGVALMKDGIVAARFGNGAELDAFLLALALPMFVINVVAGTLPAALTPAYISARTRDGIPAARLLAARALGGTYVLLTALAVVTVLASLLLPLPSGVTRSAFGWMALVLVPYTVIQGASAAWAGLLAAERRFAIGAVAPLAQPVVMAAIVLLFSRSLGAASLAVGVLAGSLAQALFMLRGMQKAGFALGRRGGMPRVVRREYVPAAAGALVMCLSPVIDQVMAASLDVGSVSALNYGGKLVAMLMGVGGPVIATTLLPMFAEHSANGDNAAIRRAMRRAERLVMLAALPSTAILIAGSSLFVTLAFEHGAFDTEAAAIVTRVQQVLLLQVPTHLLGLIYVRALSASRANRVLLIGSVLSAALNFTGNLLLMRSWGVLGIATSTSLVYLVSYLFLRWRVHHVLASGAKDEPAGSARSTTRAETSCASVA